MLMPNNDKPQLPSLNLRQQRFLQEYLKTGNATQAYRDTNYGSSKYPDRASFGLINRSPLKEHIDYFKEKSRVIDKDWILEKLELIIQKSLDPETENRRTNGETAIKALQELNKMGGHYAPTQVDNRTVSVNADVEDIRNAMLIYKKDK